MIQILEIHRKFKINMLKSLMVNVTNIRKELGNIIRKMKTLRKSQNAINKKKR